jgi:hypothetical protein
MKCQRCFSKTYEEYSNTRMAKHNKQTGRVHEVWIHCVKCDWKVWGGWEETFNGINWAPLQVFYDVSKPEPIGLI